MNIAGEHYNYLEQHEKFALLAYFIDNNKIEEAYEVVNEKGNQMARELTMYFLKEYGVFHLNPLEYLNYVPENYLYEAVDENLCIYVNDTIEEIKDWAFAFCKIKKLIISNKVSYIGDGALSLNAGEIIYQGTKDEFIRKFLGKSKCFMGSNYSHVIICADGELRIEK
jgi:hypothetical protein